MVSGIYICHWPDRELEYSRCELLLHRTYHNDVPDADYIVSSFSAHYLSLPVHQQSPFLHADGISYVSFWGANDIVIVAVSCYNANAMSEVSLLHQFYEIVAHYFSHSSIPNQPPLVVDRESIIDNYALMYELLDECVDFGQVQVTDYSILKEYIKMELNVSHSNSIYDPNADLPSSSDSDSEPTLLRSKPVTKSRRKDKSKIKSTHNRAVGTDIVNHRAEDHINSAILRTQVSAVSWRPKGIFYPKNEIYIDIAEQCDFLYDLGSQQVKTNHISGVCKVRSYLSGMPLCKLGLNEKNISRVDYDGEDLEEVEEVLEGNQLAEEQETPEPNDEDENENGGDEGTKAVADKNADKNADETQEKSEAGKVRRFRVPITNVQFHSCIELSKIYKENLILFTPPDGEFQLLSYNVDQQRRKNKEPLLMVDPVYRVLRSGNKLQIMCSLTTQFRKRLHCHGLVIRLPVSSVFPIDDSGENNFRFKSELGEVRFQVDTSEILWAIDDLPGSKKLTRMMAEISLKSTSHLSETALDSVFFDKTTVPADVSEDSAELGISELDKYYGVGGASVSSFAHVQQGAVPSNEVVVNFKIPMFTYSGLRVTYLRVDEETMKYTCFPWVRYVTLAGGGSGHTGRYRFKMARTNVQLSA